MQKLNYQIYLPKATKADLKEATDIDTSTIVSKADLTGFKTLDDLDVDSFKNVTGGLSKLNKVADNDSLKMNAYNKLNITSTSSY